MKKSLYDLTKDDWNSLFPVELVDHDENWKDIFEDEQNLIRNALGDGVVQRIEHFGSTSIAGIKAKPYIDIIIEIPNDMLFSERVISDLRSIGYTYFKVPERDNIAAYMSFGKGYNLDGSTSQIFHIHMCPKENVMWDQIAFRDYLRADAQRAREYELLKLRLEAKFRNDRGAYVLGKTEFINETLKLSRAGSAGFGDAAGS